MTENAAERRRHGAAGRLLAALGVAGTLFVLAALALIAWNTRTVPWALPLLESGRPSSLLLALLHESRYEVLACAVAAANVGWLLWRLGRAPLDPEPPKGDPAALPEPAEEPVAPTSSTRDGAGAARLVRTDSGAAQLEIAATELSRLRRELGSCRLQLDAANAVKAQFLSNMSHELRTPLNGIMGMTDLLLGGELAARERRFAQSIAASSSTLLAVIGDLLDFSRIEAGTLYLERSRFGVRDAVEDACSMLADLAHARGIELVCYVDDNVPGLADGDASRLRQVIDNLVRNAIAFTEEGEVVVRMTHVEERGPVSLYRCDVQDTGAGISPEMQMVMFDAFTRESDAAARTRGGLGVGLTISRQLVAMMGGEIRFRSRLGEGTRFWFTVELGTVEGGAEEETCHRPVHGARVMVVDDNETNRAILYHQLSGWGVHADTADCAEVALERLHRAAADGVRYDALVLDLDMPGMNGIELARRIRADETLSGVPSLMLTSALLDVGAEELAELGIERYVSKPPRQSVLYDSLVSLLPRGGIAAGPPVTAAARAETVPISARVLIVEDNLVSRDVGVGMLESVGCRVDVACDGKEALERTAESAYDLILMDCRMPGMDGYEATAAIRAGEALNARTPIVALTANAMAGDRARCLEAGMDDYLAKPVRRDDLTPLLLRWVKPSAPTDEEAPAEPSATRRTLINHSAIDTIRGLQRPGKPDLLGKVLGVYFDKTPAIVEAMRAALATRDAKAIKEQAHSLKSSSAYVGAEGLADKCKRIERASGDADFDEIAALVSEIAEEFEAVSVELEVMLEAA